MKYRIAPLLILLMAWAAAPARGQATPAAILAALGSDQYAVRQRVTDQLLADRGRSVDEIVRLYASATSPEQRYRLMAVAMHYTVRQMVDELSTPAIPPSSKSDLPAPAAAVVPDSHASLGVSLGAGLAAEQLPEIGWSAVCINNVYPGFPAYGMLQPGDLITEVDHQLLPTDGDRDMIRDAFRKMIQDHAAGSELTLRVFRQNRWLNIKLRTVSLDLLSSLYLPNPFGNSSSANPEGLQSPYLERWLGVRQRLLAVDHHLPPLLVHLDASTTPAGKKLAP